MAMFVQFSASGRIVLIKELFQKSCLALKDVKNFLLRVPAYLIFCPFLRLLLNRGFPFVFMIRREGNFLIPGRGHVYINLLQVNKDQIKVG